MSARENRAFREYYKGLAELFEMMTGMPAPDLESVLKAARGRGRAEPPGSGQKHSRPTSAAAVPVPTRESDRLKELYRTLVRQLHPDRNPKQSAREREFWHQVQAAYRLR